MAIVISKAVATKIGQPDHGSVTEKEVHECFANFSGLYAEDLRPQHKTGSGAPTFWFVGETNHLRKLKIMFVPDGDDLHLKSAYPATQRVESLFRANAKHSMRTRSRK